MHRAGILCEMLRYEHRLGVNNPLDSQLRQGVSRDLQKLTSKLIRRPKSLLNS